MYVVYEGVGCVCYGVYENKEEARNKMHEVFQNIIDREFPEGIDWGNVLDYEMGILYDFEFEYEWHQIDVKILDVIK